MSIYEYDEERQRQFDKAEGREAGRVEGKAEAVMDLLEGLGQVNVELKNHILIETNMEMLTAWLKIAARSDSIEQFITDAGIRV